MLWAGVRKAGAKSCASFLHHIQAQQGKYALVELVGSGGSGGQGGDRREALQGGREGEMWDGLWADRWGMGSGPGSYAES